MRVKVTLAVCVSVMVGEGVRVALAAMVGRGVLVAGAVNGLIPTVGVGTMLGEGTGDAVSAMIQQCGLRDLCRRGSLRRREITTC